MKCSPISIRLTPAIRARLEERAQGRSLAEVIRTDLERFWTVLDAQHPKTLTVTGWAKYMDRREQQKRL
jgi:hypothetical protein